MSQRYGIIFYTIILILAISLLGEAQYNPFSYHKIKPDLEIIISTNETEIYRGDSVLVSYQITPRNENAENIVGLIHIPTYFRYLRLTKGSHYCYFNPIDQSIKILVNIRCLNKNEDIIISYEAAVPLNAALGKQDITKTIRISEWDWNYLDARGQFILIDNAKINIKDNPPHISSANVTIKSDPPTPVHNHTLLFSFREYYKPIEVVLNVTANDKDDENLTYTWIIQPIGKILSQNNKTHQICTINDLSPGNYWLEVRASGFKEFDVARAEIWYDREKYETFVIKTIPFSNRLNRILIFLIFLILIVIGFLKKSLTMRISQFTRDGSITWIFILTILVLLWITWWILIRAYSLNLWAYLTSFEFFVVFIYLNVFIVVAYFTEICFTQYDQIDSSKLLKSTTSYLWIFNSIAMTFMLIFLTFIIPLIEIRAYQDASFADTWSQYLQWYYSTVAQVFASILSIVVVIHTALPNKNIVTINYSDPKINDNNLHKSIDKKYKYPEIVKHFVILYGIVLVLSFIGLSSGVRIDFGQIKPFIDININRFLDISYSYNIFSLILFEITLLLIPPAVSCLYTLLRVIAFTGTVKIISRPCGAKIYLKSNEYPEVVDTELMTPAKLMLHKGKYFISLKKDGFKSFEIKKPIYVIRGTEQTYNYKLEPQQPSSQKTTKND